MIGIVNSKLNAFVYVCNGTDGSKNKRRFKRKRFSKLGLKIPNAAVAICLFLLRDAAPTIMTNKIALHNKSEPPGSAIKRPPGYQGLENKLN